VENEGVWEVFQDPVLAATSESVVQVPVNVTAGGKFLVSTNGHVNFVGSSSLTVAGTLEIQSGALLRMGDSGVTRDVTLLGGSVNTGAGTIRFEGGNRLALSGNVTVSFGLVDFVGSSSVTGLNLLTISSGSTFQFDHSSTIPGSVTVNGTLTLTSASITLTIGGTLNLNAGGTLNNPGTVRVGGFVNNGGTINGNAPVALAQGSVVRIAELRFEDASADLSKVARHATATEIVLRWTGPRDASFVVQASSDLVRWSDVTASVRETDSSSFEGRLPMPRDAHRFYRVRCLIK
jgi:hypothetical protein